MRDAPDLGILECRHCGLVTLSSLSHIEAGCYEESGMHGASIPSVAEWLKTTDADDQRRFDMLRSLLPNKKLLDFGCGAGGFLAKAKSLAGTISGVEVEQRVGLHWGARLSIYPDLQAAGGPYDLITAFHVIEHLLDPRGTLKTLANMLAKNGRLVLEVPSSSDALLSLYDLEAFQRFTYWSKHLFLFNADTVQQLASQADLRVVAIQQYQRYPLSNHLHWLSQGKPGGHQSWSFLDTPALTQAYAASLAAVGKCDTLIVYLETDTP